MSGYRPAQPELKFLNRCYTDVILFEDTLTEAACLAFANELQLGQAHIGEFPLRHSRPQWYAQTVSLNNDFMRGSGLVASARVTSGVARIPVGPLLEPGLPYYPDIHEASRDWLPFARHYGQSDGRIGQIHFLLRESRALIAGATYSDGWLSILVSGKELDSLELSVKGAYWKGNEIRHIEGVVVDSVARVFIENDASRLEYFLIDSTGTVFDFYREDIFSRSVHGSVLGSSSRSLETQVRTALSAGEGGSVEFKPFIDPAQKRHGGTEKTKFDEVVLTVVAFANADGGSIYLGVSDDCEPVGVAQKLCEWAKAACTQETIDRYTGALRNRIKSCARGELALDTGHALIDGALVIVIQVAQASTKPVGFHDEKYLYARRGASNKKIPPEDWRSVLDPSGISGLQ